MKIAKDAKGNEYPRSVWSDGYRDKWKADMIAAGHTPKVDEDGDIDMFVVDAGYHNGPGCAACGWSECIHCFGEKPIPPCTQPAEGVRIK